MKSYDELKADLVYYGRRYLETGWPSLYYDFENTLEDMYPFDWGRSNDLTCNLERAAFNYWRKYGKRER